MRRVGGGGGGGGGRGGVKIYFQKVGLYLWASEGYPKIKF